MKRILFTILFLVAAQFANAQAQDDAFKKDVQKMMDMMGVLQQVEYMREYYIMWTTPEKEKEFIEKLDPTIPEFIKKTEDYFMSKYTHDEVKAIISFYETPAGKKLTANSRKYIDLYNEVDDRYTDRYIEITFAKREGKYSKKKE